MRLIDADALAERLNIKESCAECEYEHGGFCKKHGNFVDACEAIFDAPTIQPEPHWIPVDLENNKPQLEEWVLVSSDGYVMQDCIVERGGEKIWYHGGNIQADDRYMPLPEPYKGVTT